MARKQSLGDDLKYDDATWHSGGDFPEDLPDEAGGTHIAMFVAWALLSDLGGTLHTDDFAEDLAALKARQMTPGEYFFASCDGKFTDEDLNRRGNAFASFYFDDNDRGYLADYDDTLGGDVPTLYHVADSWDTFDRIRSVLDERYAAWRKRSGRKKDDESAEA